ncbi:S-layer domain-containing protein [Gottschalkia purinilytica]|uniref:S-layer domain-containing protein n=1 Tax=Gottschalkia purinilytica TaxID=1503 RepID=A0A0L0WE90_GOTPU|nr:S-layer homology domain-containing protein [Gottschalkia purinilytica]KNF09751.1 S-layer domain-containing protein [Gottschalkia purinilytica]
MKLKNKKVASIALATLITITTQGAYASAFKDVSNDYWARQFIDSMNKEGIIAGYDDGTFRPLEDVSKVQAIVLSTRLFKATNSEIQQARQTYKGVLDSSKVPEWYKGGVAIALSKGIINQDMVKTLYDSKNKEVPATKEEICVYLTKVMGLEEEANKKVNLNLPFKDKHLISPQAAPYVEVMLDKGVIDKQGDGSGNFSPKSTMNRAMTAKVISVAFDYLKNNDVDKETTTVKGTITSILRFDSESYVTIENDRGIKVSYKADGRTIINLDNKNAGISDLVEGLNVTAKVTKDLRAVSISAESINENYEGTVSKVTSAYPGALTIEYKKDGKTDKKTFVMDNDISVTLDNKKANLWDIKEGDNAKIKVKNSKIIEIKAESKIRNIEGTIKEIKYNPEPVLVIEDKYKDVYEYSIDSKAKIYRDKKSSGVTDLRRGDKVDVEVEYNVIVDIYASTVKSKDEGVIKGISISANKAEITILNKDKKTVTYYIPKQSTIYVDNERSSIYNLKLEYYINLEIEGEEVTRIDAKSIDRKDSYNGVVSYINKNADIIGITVSSQDDEKQSITIMIDNRTKILDTDGREKGISSLSKGDKVFVLGDFDGTILLAKTIMITQYAK